MRVSFGPTSHGPPPNGQGDGERQNDDEHVYNAAENSENAEEHDIRKLRRERDECLKREEALRDRLKLQETLSNKQIQELRGQIRRMTTENQKTPRARDSISTPGGVRSERKRDTKQVREVKELQKTVENLKTENEALQGKLKGLSEFVKVAGELKTRAVNQCAAKEKIVRTLKSELHSVERLFEDERRQRIQTESELNSLRTYVDYISHKRREKLRGKLVQTETSIPPKLIIGTTGSEIDFTPSNTSSFANLSATAASWRLKHVERDYQEETRQSKEKFNNAATENRKPASLRRSSEKSARQVQSVVYDYEKKYTRHESESDAQKSKFSASSTSGSDSTKHTTRAMREILSVRVAPRPSDQYLHEDQSSRDFTINSNTYVAASCLPAVTMKGRAGNVAQHPRAYKARQ